MEKANILLDNKFHEFSFGKIRFFIGFHFLNLWAFAVSFPNGGSTIVASTKYFDCKNALLGQGQVWHQSLAR